MCTHLKAIFVRVVFVLASTLIGLLICEEIVRFVAPQNIAVPWQSEINGIMAPRPNVQGRHTIPNTFDVTVSFNSQRFRGRRDFQLEPSPGVIRLAALGDSFTFGFGANDNETYPAQLERILQRWLAESASHSTVEVINASNAGSGTGEQALWYDTWVKQFRPQLAVLTVVPNDIDDDLARGLFFLDENGRALPRPFKELSAADRPLRVIRRAVNAFPGYAFLAQYSQLLAFLRNFSSAAVGRYRQATFATDATPSQTGSPSERFQKEGLPMMAEEVRWLQKRVQKSGAHLVVVFVPFRETIYSSQTPASDQIQWKSEAIAEVLSEVCSQEGIPFADLTAQIREQARQLPKALYYDGFDNHPTPEGYRIIAEAIAKFLVENFLLKHE